MTPVPAPIGGGLIFPFVIPGAVSPTTSGSPRAPETPVMQWPFRMNSTETAINYVEQDTPEEVAQRVAFLFSTNIGDLPDEPAFGIPEPIFKQEGISEEELTRPVSKWVPEALLIFSTNELANLMQTLDVQVGALS